MKPAIQDIESYSCETYGVTMEQVENRQTRKKNILQARRMILYLITKYTDNPINEVTARCKMSNETVSNFYYHIERNRKVDIELNSVITEFEKKHIKQ